MENAVCGATTEKRPYTYRMFNDTMFLYEGKLELTLHFRGFDEKCAKDLCDMLNRAYLRGFHDSSSSLMPQLMKKKISSEKSAE